MALTYFKLWNDDAMTSEFDWSGGDKLQFSEDGYATLYFGSTDSTKQCRGSGDTDMVITPTHAIAEWEASTAYSLTNKVRTVSKLGYHFQCTTAGTSGATEPNWATADAVDDTIVDGTVTWTNIGKLHELTEIKLASTYAGLASATAGAALNIGKIAAGGTGTAKQIWIQMTDATGGLASTNLSLAFNELEELAV